MNKHLLPKFLIISIAILFVLVFTGLTFAQEVKTAPSVEDISDLKVQAKKYRELGLECQQMGDLTQALSFYQKAIAIYPNFAIVYNDLGVIYEQMGSFDRAEENYLKSNKIDPTYASVYTNLALFYENQRDLEKAAFYWGKRAEIGFPDDPWKQKAIKRIRDIRMSTSSQPFSGEQEEEVLGLMKDVAENKVQVNKDDGSLSQTHFKKAKESFEKGDMATAIKEALDAQYLDQKNPEIEAFIEQAERRALTR